jgi:hypothetical protein
MIAGDYIDSRNAAIRHDLPSCGADVPHDEMQLAALTNKLAGFDGTGTARTDCAQLLPQRAYMYDYDLPRAASSDLVLVKQVGGSNVFNQRRSLRVGRSDAASGDGDGMLQLPSCGRRDALAPPSAGAAAPPSRLPQIAQPLLALADAPVPVASNKRKWVPPIGCACADENAHTAHVAKVKRAWACGCQSGAKGRAAHHHDCVRGAMQQHRQPFRRPTRGERVQMVGEARRCGKPDVVYDGRAWVVDPEGRPVQQSAWVTSQLL